MTPRRCNCILAIALLVGCATGQALDLPVATGGMEAWAEIVAQAMSHGGKTKEESLEALKSFQSSVLNNFQEKAKALQDVSHGDFSGLMEKILEPKVQITAPVFFDNSPAFFKASAKGLDMSVKGVNYAPCAFVVNPQAVSVGATGINISPTGISIAPTAVNVNPFGASISPSVIVIAPYDTTVAGQGLNIAPALIVVAPVKTVYNPVGPLNIGGALVTQEVQAP